MRKHLSLLAFLLIAAIAMWQRCQYPIAKQGKDLKLTTWDAFGYYMYLPATFVYQDVTQLKWLPEIDSQYALTGGQLYQAGRYTNGNYVYKYLGGVAILQSPFFFAAHHLAPHLGYPADGFSKPYQWAIAIAAMFYFLLGLWVLRKVLRFYFSEGVTAITLLLLTLATNLLQYTAVEGGMSHAYIFPLYALMLYTTIRWHRQPKVVWAFFTGLFIGLATICRPVEAAMFLIPLLWDTHTKEAKKAKWQQVKAHKFHIVLAILAGLLGILPQLLYWKAASGSYIYDVGSKWDFLNPHFRVLFGWEKGWFIYTPVTILFIIGMFLRQATPFRKSVLWFCLINIWVVIAWSDWRYGASYSTRALIESYPVFALPLAVLVSRVVATGWRIPFYIAGLYLIAVNLFQTWQYNHIILHYNDMNRHYYARIYLNAHPTPLDMSALDSNEILTSESGYRQTILLQQPTTSISFPANDTFTIAKIPLHIAAKTSWLKIESTITASQEIDYTFLNAAIKSATGQPILHHKVRLSTAITNAGQPDNYIFYIALPQESKTDTLHLYLTGNANFTGTINSLKATLLEK